MAEYAAILGRPAIKDAVERELDRVRLSGENQSYETIRANLIAALDLARFDGLIPAVNATGILVHTNLGRAPLAAEALSAIERVAHGYSNLEYDLVNGTRGSRTDRVTALLREITGAQDALVVNNCAAAVLLVLDTFAKGREVIVARNQLVEIGGGFRVPDVLERSGCTLVEVGATNKVYLDDFERALSPRTALLLRTHPSNYRIEGFTHDVDGASLARLGRRAGVPVVEDLGSGAVVDLAQYGALHERTVQEALADDIDLVMFSGDKLLGGPQAGIVCGSARLIGRLRNNPLVRALRVDKLTLAALGATLRLHRDPASRRRIPLYRMLSEPFETLRTRAQPYLAALPGSMLVESRAYVGGGALPESTIPSLAIAWPLAHPDAVAARIRCDEPAIVARIERDRLLLDLRTIAPDEDDTVIATITYGAPEIFEA